MVLEGEGGLGFVKDVDALAGESVFKQGHEAFAVREFVEIKIVIVHV